MNDKDLLILEILFQNRGWMSGKEIVAQSQGQLISGPVYLRLRTLNEQGLIDMRQETAEEFQRNSQYPGALPRSLYKIKEQGIQEYREHAAASFDPLLAPA